MYARTPVKTNVSLSGKNLELSEQKIFYVIIQYVIWILVEEIIARVKTNLIDFYGIHSNARINEQMHLLQKLSTSMV